MADLDADRLDHGALAAVQGLSYPRSASRPVGQSSLGARALYLFQGNHDTLYRIHGTNEPAEIGQAVSSGCIRMRNFDAIDLYNRVHIGTACRGDLKTGSPVIAGCRS